MKLDIPGRITQAFFMATLVLALSACTVYQDDGPDPRGQNQKVFVCHKGNKNLQVDEHATRAHLKHGDSLGRCGG